MRLQEFESLTKRADYHHGKTAFDDSDADRSRIDKAFELTDYLPRNAAGRIVRGALEVRGMCMEPGSPDE